MAWHTSISALTEFSGFWPSGEVKYGVDPDALWGFIDSGNQPKLDEALLIPDVCQKPAGIWRGLVRPGQENTLCVAGTPNGAFAASHSLDCPARQRGRVFAVFLTAERLAVKWRWERADSGQPDLPTSFNARFGELIWPQ